MTSVASGGPRLHGFEKPLSPGQPVVWFLVIFSLVVFASLVAPALVDDVKLLITSCVLYGLLYAVATICFFHASHRDPGTAVEGDREEAGTKHCWICKKWVKDFDHHCPYLNVCIGRNNYHSFFVLTCSTLAGFTLQLVLAGWVAGVVYPSNVGLKNPRVSLVGLVLLSIGSIVPFIGWWAIAILFVFHVYLWFTGLTTYEWILNRRDAKEQKARKRSARHRKARLLKTTVAAKAAANAIKPVAKTALSAVSPTCSNSTLDQKASDACTTASNTASKMADMNVGRRTTGGEKSLPALPSVELAGGLAVGLAVISHEESKLVHVEVAV